MKILITAGGTSENIDKVRNISNNSTGRLGMFIADEFIKKANASITYVCGENVSISPKKNMEIIKIRSIDNLISTLGDLFNENEFDCVIHAMAVSDYKVKGITSIENLSLEISQKLFPGKDYLNSIDDFKNTIKACIQGSINDSFNCKKIGSDIVDLMMLMENTPKVISMIKTMQPKTVLVGFKLLFGVNEEILLHRGYDLLVKNNCDFVFANDFENIKGDNHEGILINDDRSYTRFCSKREIAMAIVESVLSKI